MQQIAKRAKATGAEWVLVRQGSRHELWQFAAVRVTIPRHNDINELTAKAILKDIEEV
jgi:mRNA interferase HicA